LKRISQWTVGRRKIQMQKSQRQVEDMTT
jgi:hypothetical protein